MTNNNAILYQRVGPNTYHKYKIPAILQPRLTWRYLLCSAAAIYVTYCFLFSMPLFCHKLPDYTGPYEVGAIDIEVPLEQPRLLNNAFLKDTDQYAFEVETVLFTLYYPASNAKSRRSKHYWISKPLAATAEGYTKFAHVNNFVVNKIVTGSIGMTVGGLKIPAKVDVPLADVTPAVNLVTSRDPRDSETTLVDSEDGAYPIIVFTHGMASSRTDYTQWCGEMASRGYVIAAIEHRDGSSPGTVVTKNDGSVRKLLHFSVEDIQSSPEMDRAAFKEAQIAFRQAEIEETVKVIKLINRGHGGAIFEANSRKEGVDLHNWTSRLNTREMIIGGHSYGATGALNALKPSLLKHTPFSAGIILDPGKSSGHLNSDISVPILVVHSNSWSSRTSIFEGRPHFDVVYDLVSQNNVRGNPSWFMTSLGTSHPSITDAPLLITSSRSNMNLPVFLPSFTLSFISLSESEAPASVF